MENFEKYLIDKYPHLFYDNKNGELKCPCGVYAPVGWQNIVDDLCGAITSYTKHTYRNELRVVNKMFYFWRGIATALDWMHKKFIKVFPKYNKWQYNKPVFAFIAKIRRRYFTCAVYDKVYPPPVKIDQIKEKFGELRVYITGGDKEVRGMISFAEYLCNKTCEVSGEKGELCSRNGWLKTLSASTREKDAYKDYKPTK